MLSELIILKMATRFPQVSPAVSTLNQTLTSCSKPALPLHIFFQKTQYCPCLSKPKSLVHITPFYLLLQLLETF